MRCPIDQSELRVTEREDVEIDVCPTCRGVWLDRGELDKIIDRFASDRAAVAGAHERRSISGQRYGPPARSYDDDHDDDDRRRYRGQRGERYDDDDDDRDRGRKRRGWLGNLFDF